MLNFFEKRIRKFKAKISLKIKIQGENGLVV